MGIYLRLDKQPKNLEELFSELYNYYSTDYDMFKSVETFNDPECNYRECHSGKYRSIDDSIVIAQTYFPTASLAEIVTAMIAVTKTRRGVVYRFAPVHCPTISKPTYVYAETYYRYINHDLQLFHPIDEMKDSQFKSWGEVLKVIGINSMEDLNLFMKNL